MNFHHFLAGFIKSSRNRVIMPAPPPKASMALCVDDCPPPGTPLECIICSRTKPWGIFTSKREAVCIECRDKARQQPVSLVQANEARRNMTRDEIEADNLAHLTCHGCAHSAANLPFPSCPSGERPCCFCIRNPVHKSGEKKPGEIVDVWYDGSMPVKMPMDCYHSLDMKQQMRQWDEDSADQYLQDQIIAGTITGYRVAGGSFGMEYVVFVYREGQKFSQSFGIEHRCRDSKRLRAYNAVRELLVSIESK